MDKVITAIDRELAQAESQRSKIAGRITRLTKARAILVGVTPAKAKRTTTTARSKAGPAAISKVQETLTGTLNGRATQARIAAAAGVNSGQVSAALADLEARGIVRRTGAKEGRSFEFELVGAGS